MNSFRHALINADLIPPLEIKDDGEIHSLGICPDLGINQGWYLLRTLGKFQFGLYSFAILGTIDSWNSKLNRGVTNYELNIMWEHIERFKDFIKNVDLNGSKEITHQKKMISDKKIFT